jgi:DNA polymerase-3 subunit beta
MPNDFLTLNIDNTNNLKLSCKNINYSLVTIAPDEYPQLNFQTNAKSFNLKSKQILEIINKTSHAISTDETRLYLNGIYLQNIDSKLRAVAIDGHRLALLNIDEFMGEISGINDGVIIPRKGITELKKLAETYPEDSIKLSIDDSFIYAQAHENYFLSVRLIAREYPKYQTVIPSKTIYNFRVDKDLLQEAVRRIKILSNEKTNGIKVQIKKNEITLNANHPSLGQAVEKINLSYDGKEMDIGFNAKYLLDSLSVFNPGEITLEFNNELSPVVIKSEDLPSFLGIIMPLKL